MAVQFPIVGSTIFTTFTSDTVPNSINGINNALIAAGWTQITKLHSQAIMTISPLPTNNSTFTIGGVTYTFKTTINNANPNEITIAANTTQQATFVADAILAVTGGGSEWSTPTVANTIVTATSSTNVVTFTSIASGLDANSQFTLASAFGNPTSQGRGFVTQCAATPQGLQANIYIVDTVQAGTSISVWWGSADGTLQSGSLIIGQNNAANGGYGTVAVTGGRTLHICCNAHQFFTWLTGDKATRGCQVGMCIPYLRAGQTPLSISALTNSSGLFEVQTGTAHGLTTGQSVTLFGGNLPAGATGPFTVTVIDTTHFTLNGSTYAGGYTTGGLVGGSGGVGQIGGISRCFFGWADNASTGAAVNGSYLPQWRNRPASGQGFYCINENSWGDFTGTSTKLGNLIFPQPSLQQAYYNWGGFSNSSEALVGWPGTAEGAGLRGVGEIWGALVVCDSIPMDATNTGYLSHNWINQTDFDTIASLWLATT